VTRSSPRPSPTPFPCGGRSCGTVTRLSAGDRVKPPRPAARDTTLPVVVLRGLCSELARAGVDVHAMLRELAIDPALIADPDARLPAAVVFRAFEAAPGRAHDDLFGLHAGARAPLGAFAVFDVALRNSRTLGEAAERACRYYRLIDDRTEMKVIVDGDLARVTCRNLAMPSVSRTSSELLLATIVTRGRQLAGCEWPMRAVHFVAEGPRDHRAHERFFAAPVRFGQPADELVFDRSWLDRPVLDAEPSLATFFDRHIASLGDQDPGGDPFADRVRRAIGAALDDRPSLARTARQLGVSSRTLQRKLGALGTSYAELVDSVRRTVATRCLETQDVAISEVAYVVGFAEVSAFHRAFKRWTGTTPTEFRRAHRAGAVT